jgi:heme-degrading monooxygenase HmoA
VITVANRIYVTPEYRDRFEARFRDRAGLVDAMPGFVFNQLLRPTRPDAPYVVLTVWEDLASFQAWVGSDAFKQGHARSGTLPKEAFSRRNELEIHQIVLDSRDPDLEPEAPFEVEAPHA